MNNNLRGIRSTSDKQSYKNSGIGTRHSSISTPNNNIHININLNVKKKSQCIIHEANPTGKKINNFVQVHDPKNPHEGSGMTDEHEKQSQQLMKSTAIGKAKFITTNKKSEADKKMQKTKKKKTKQKEKTASKPFTPQKQQKGQSQQKSFERSKTGKKLVKKKESKSMQNLKVFKDKHTVQNRKIYDLMNNNKDNKFKSKSNSSSKQRSRQKSATKLKKNRSSSKNIAPFQNSGIKKVLATQRDTTINKSEGLQHLRKSKKSLKSNKLGQKDLIKINEFMQQKKKNDDRKKKQSEFSSKGIRIKDELLKASRQKKQFFSKPEKKQSSHGLQSRKNSKFPIYFGDEDENNQVQDLSVFHIQRNTNFSNHRTPQKSRVQSLKISPQSNKKSGTKRKEKLSLFQKYKHGRLTSAEYEKLLLKIVKIQANWRGYWTRKNMMQQIAKMNRLALEKKKLINEKKSEFWDDDDNNSITNLQYEAKQETYKQAIGSYEKNQYFNGSGFSFRTPQGSNYNSSSTPTDQIHTNNKKYESQSGNEMEQNQYEHEDRIRIDDFKKNIVALQREKQELKSKKSQQKYQRRRESVQQESVTNQQRTKQSKQQQSSMVNNNYLVSQIELLRKQLQEQNKKFSQLQKENTELKENLMSVIVDKKQNKQNKQKKQKGKQSKISCNNGKSKINRDIKSREKWNNGSQQSERSYVVDGGEQESVEICDIEMIDKNNVKETQNKNNNNINKQISKNTVGKNKFKNLKIQTEEEVEKPIIKQTIVENKNNIKDNNNNIKDNNNKSNQQSLSIKSPSSSSSYVQSLKRQLSSFESPSNRQLKSAQLSGLKNLQKAFKKKQLSIQLTYEKNTTMYQQMLQNNIVSPRTYNFKKIQLDEKYKKQKEQISTKFKQAQKVMKYINEEIIVQQEKAGQDQSPKKQISTKTQQVSRKQQNKIETIISRELLVVGNTKITQAVSVNASEQQSHELQYSQSQYESHVIKQIKINKNNQNNNTNKTNIVQNRELNNFTSGQIQVFNQNSSSHSNFRKYWTDDIDEVHQKVLQISNKIDQALLQADTERLQYQQQLNRNRDRNRDQQQDQDQDIGQGQDLSNSEMKSQELKEYSSENSNFYSLNDQNNSNSGQHQNNTQLMSKITINNNLNKSVKSSQEEQQQSIYQQSEYRVQEEQVMGNTSSLSYHSDKSGRSLYSYNIHYPSSPSNTKNNNNNNTNARHHFQVTNQLYYDDQQHQQLQPQHQQQFQKQQSSIQNNNSQLSQNRSCLSQSNNSMVSSSTTKNKQQKGFDTRLTFIKQYCIALCEFIRSEDQLKQKFISNISTPLKYDYLDYLKSYRLTIQLKHDTKYNSTLQEYFYPYFKLVKGSIVPKGLNQQNTNKFDQLYNHSYGIHKQLTPQMLQIRKFFIHAIIDVFNQSLDFQRPGSVYGQPLPWLVQSRNLKNNHVKFLKQPQINSNLLRHKNSSDDSQNEENEQDQRLDRIFGIAIAKIIQWGSCLCGFIPQPVSFDGEQAQAVNIDQEQTNLVRQTRLAYMLEKSLTQDEQKMVDHTMQQLQVQLQLQQIIFQQLINQCVNQMHTFKQ